MLSIVDKWNDLINSKYFARIFRTNGEFKQQFFAVGLNLPHEIFKRTKNQFIYLCNLVPFHKEEAVAELFYRINSPK
jgi:hypothetical protein